MLTIISIDTGRANTKVIAPNMSIQFPSIVSEWYERTLSKGGDYELELNGHKYFAGELAREGYCRTINASRSKIHEEMRLLFVTALATVNPPGETIIVTGVPVDQHQEDIKREIRQYLRGSHEGSINGRPFKFYVKALEICPEGASAYWDYVLDDKGSIVKDTSGTYRIVDIGSKTINVATIINQRYLNRESFTLDYGCYDYLNAKNKDSGQFFKRIWGDLMQRWSDYLETDKVLFSGGGSLLLVDHIGQIIPDPLMANARGFRKLGVAKWAGK